MVSRARDVALGSGFSLVDVESIAASASDRAFDSCVGVILAGAGGLALFAGHAEEVNL